MRALLLSIVLAVGLSGCSGAALTALFQCRVAAVQKLPLQNPDLINVGDVRSLVADLKACQPATGDAGPAL
jgi:hypothetical protein